MYWVAFAGSTEPPSSKIKRTNLDGSDAEDLVAGLPFPDDIALDVVNGKMYWTESVTPSNPATVRRANVEIPPGETPSTRTDIENLIIGTTAHGIALDI